MKTLDDTNAENQTGRDPDPQAGAQHRDSAKKATNLINELPPNQQEVIRLKVHGGMSYREISEVTGLSISNVGYLLHVGLKTVRGQLATAD